MKKKVATASHCFNGDINKTLCMLVDYNGLCSATPIQANSWFRLYHITHVVQYIQTIPSYTTETQHNNTHIY